MDFDEMYDAVQDAKQTQNIADRQVYKMARLIVGKLQSGGVSDYTLRRLKKELAGYNMHTSRWKD